MTNEPGPDRTPAPSPEAVPPVTVEWVAQPGDARRATLDFLLRRRTWIRPLLIGLAVGVVVTAVCVATGSGWPLGLTIGAAFFAGVVLEMVLVAFIVVYRHNRKGLAAGARWAAGSDAARIRFDSPISTVVLDRANVQSIERSRHVAVLTVPPKHRLGIPVALLPAILPPDGARPDLID